MDPRTKNEDRELRRLAMMLDAEIARLPVREGKSSGRVRGRIIFAQADGTVSSSDPTFSFHNGKPVVPGTRAPETGTAQNNFARDIPNDHWLHLFEDLDSGNWLTFDVTGTGGSQVIGFRLTEDKTYADEAKLAKPILEDGTVDSGADAFNVVDHEHQFWGKGPYTDADAEAEVWPGYLGYCVRFTDDWNSTGVPGYRIIAMEGPAQWIRVTLKENVGETNPDEALANYVGSQDFHGRPFSGRRPLLEDLSSNGHFAVFADSEIGEGGKEAEDWICKWSEKDGEHHYFLWKKIAPLLIRVRGTTTTSVAASDATFAVSNVEVIHGEMPALTGGNLTINNTAKIPIPNSKEVEFRWCEEDEQWQTEPIVGWHIKGLSVGAVTGGSFTLDNIEVISGSDPRTDPSSATETITVLNEMEWDADDNAIVYAHRKAYTTTWLAYQVKCPA